MATLWKMDYILELIYGGWLEESIRFLFYRLENINYYL